MDAVVINSTIAIWIYLTGFYMGAGLTWIISYYNKNESNEPSVNESRGTFVGTPIAQKRPSPIKYIRGLPIFEKVPSMPPVKPPKKEKD